MTDDTFATFGDVLTVYGSCKLNLAAMNDLPLLGKVAAVRAMLSAAIKNPSDPGLAEPNATMLSVEAAKELDFRGSSFSPLTDPNQLAQMFKDPMKQMTHLALSSSPPPNIIGVDVDPQRLSQMLASPQNQQTSRRIYRIEAKADVGAARHKITAIWDSRKIKQFTANPDKPGDAVGNWIYFREE